MIQTAAMRSQEEQLHAGAERPSREEFGFVCYFSNDLEDCFMFIPPVSSQSSEEEAMSFKFKLLESIGSYIQLCTPKPLFDMRNQL